jgi:hypothetical protein
MKLGPRATFKLLLDADHSFHEGLVLNVRRPMWRAEMLVRVGEMNREGPQIDLKDRESRFR